jgi:hypothetical protein
MKAKAVVATMILSKKETADGKKGDRRRIGTKLWRDTERAKRRIGFKPYPTESTAPILRDKPDIWPQYQ